MQKTFPRKQGAFQGKKGMPKKHATRLDSTRQVAFVLQKDAASEEQGHVQALLPSLEPIDAEIFQKTGLTCTEETIPLLKQGARAGSLLAQYLLASAKVAHQELSNIPDLAQSLKTLEQIAPRFPLAYSVLADFAFADDHDQACRYLEQGAHAHLVCVPCQRRYGQLLVEQEAYGQGMHWLYKAALSGSWLSLHALLTLCQELLSINKRAKDVQDYAQRGMTCLLSICKQDYAPALLLLGKIQLAGILQQANFEQAYANLERANQLGEHEAALVLALALLDEEDEGFDEADMRRGVELLEEYPYELDPSINVLLGNIYEQGLSVDADLEKAQGYYQKAYAAGNKEAAHALAMLILDGKSQAMSVGKSLTLLEEAAAEAVPEALADLGVLLLSGHEALSKDTERGLALLVQAANAGLEDAYGILAHVYLEGLFSVEKDPTQGLAWLAKGLESNEARSCCLQAQRLLGDLEGFAPRKDKTQTALDLLADAADAGDSLANAVLALRLAKEEQAEAVDILTDALEEAEDAKDGATFFYLAKHVHQERTQALERVIAQCMQSIGRKEQSIDAFIQDCLQKAYAFGETRRLSL